MGPRILGVRTGISLGKEDFTKLGYANGSKPKLQGSFVYVISDGASNVKIGVSTDPIARLATLQTSHHSPLTFEYIGATSSDGYAIEADAHDSLSSHRLNGEWFAVPPAYAVAAIHGAAHHLGLPIVQVQADMVPMIISQATAVPSRKLTGLAWVAATLLWSVICFVVFAFIALAIKVIMDK